MLEGTMSVDAAPPSPGQVLWGGVAFSAWLRLLARHRFAVDPPWRALALGNTALSFAASLLGFVQTACYGRQIARTVIREPPLFVLGFYRSGTTFLHNLLCLDSRHTFPNTYECFMANHFLITEDYVTRRFPLKATRAMDDVPMTWSQPQEDEFALCMLGQPSFYLSLVFPNAPAQDTDYFDMERVPRRARAAWKRTLYRFLQAVTFKRPGRLVVKSPSHTARIKILLEMFPEARFVHIIRDPYHVYDSTVKMLKAMQETFGLQRPRFAGLEEFILRTYPKMIEKLEEGRALVAPSRFHELRYEALAHAPAAQMERLYDHLDLGGFEEYRPRLERFLADTRSHKPNPFELPADARAEVTRRWGEIIRRYGYGQK
jgi:omega-hydroxy-beta-dihydromenaquinone-9 sulfotransferase